MPTPQEPMSPPATEQTTEPSKKSLLTRLRACFEAKVSKSAYDSLLSLYESTKRDKEQSHKDYNKLLNEATEVKANLEREKKKNQTLHNSNQELVQENENLKNTLAEIEKFVVEAESVTEDSE